MGNDNANGGMVLFLMGTSPRGRVPYLLIEAFTTRVVRISSPVRTMMT
jgi:hypothetical protein